MGPRTPFQWQEHRGLCLDPLRYVHAQASGASLPCSGSWWREVNDCATLSLYLLVTTRLLRALAHVVSENTREGCALHRANGCSDCRTNNVSLG
jgi:hypothetical protein